MTVRAVIAGVVVAAATMVASTPALAGPGWSPTVRLAGFEPLPDRAIVRMDPRGDALIGEITPRIGAGRLRVAARTPDGRFGSVVAVSPPGQTVTAFDLALDRAGDGAAVWAASSGGEDLVWFAGRQLGGPFAAPTSLGPGGSPRVGMSAAGDTVVVWDGPEAGAQVAIRPAGAAGFGPPAPVLDADGSPVDDIALGVGADGTAVLAIRSSGTIQASLRAPGGAFGPAVVLSAPGVDVGAPAVAVDARGGATVAWHRRTFALERSENPVAVQEAVRSPGGAFTPGADVAAVTAPASAPAVASDDAGRTTVAWRDKTRTLAVTRPPDGAPGAAAVVAREPADDTDLQLPLALADGADGTTVIGLTSGIYPSAVVTRAAIRPAGAAAFGPLCVLSSPDTDAESPSVAVGRGTDVVAGWAEVPVGGAERMVASSYVQNGATHCVPGPAVSSVGMSPQSFAAARTGPSVGRRGARVAVTLDKPGTVTWTVQKLGGKLGRWKTLKGSFRLTVNAGKNTFRFTGRLGGKTLAPGAYRLVALPSAKNGVKGTAATVEFFIARRLTLGPRPEGALR